MTTTKEIETENQVKTEQQIQGDVTTNDTENGSALKYPFAYMQIGEYFEMEVTHGNPMMIAENWLSGNRKNWVFKSSQESEGKVRIERVK